MYEYRVFYENSESAQMRIAKKQSDIHEPDYFTTSVEAAIPHRLAKNKHKKHKAFEKFIKFT